MIGRILCGFGLHAPEPGGLWNGGYCFTECRRCGRDMVKSAFGEWHVPRNHRVVWRPPADGRVHVVAPPPVAVAEAAVARRPVKSAKSGDAVDPFDFGDFDARASSDPRLRKAGRR